MKSIRRAKTLVRLFMMLERDSDDLWDSSRLHDWIEAGTEIKAGFTMVRDDTQTVLVTQKDEWWGQRLQYR